MAHVSEQKKKTVTEFVELIKKYDIIGTVNMENLPARTMHNMREKLRDSVLIRMTKRRLITVALKESGKPGAEKLIEKMRGMPALLFTNGSPFTLYKTLKKNKSKTAIKGGQTAPNDIVVPAGPTGFAPGPVIGELGGVGIKAGIDAGKVVIKEDSTVAKEGDEVNAALAALLTRLGIEPMEIGLDLTAVLENGDILTKDVLDIDEDAYLADITAAAGWAFNLGVNAGITNSTTVVPLLQQAFSQSRNLAINEDILTDMTVGDTLAKVNGQVIALATALPDEARPEELRGVTVAAPAETASADTATSSEEKKEDDNDKKDDNGGESAAAGLGALFG